jgi:hypothetical protein
MWFIQARRNSKYDSLAATDSKHAGEGENRI